MRKILPTMALTLVSILGPLHGAHAAHWYHLYVLVHGPEQDIAVRAVDREHPRSSPVFLQRLGSGTWTGVLAPGHYRIEVYRSGTLLRIWDIEARPGASDVLEMEENHATAPTGRASVEVTAASPRQILSSTSTTHLINASLLRSLPATRRQRLQDALAETTPSVVRSHDDIAHVRGIELAIGYNINGTTLLGAMNPIFGLGPTPDVFRMIQIRIGGYRAEYGWRFGGIMDAVPRSGLGLNGHRGDLEFGWGNHQTLQGRLAYLIGRENWGIFTQVSHGQDGQYFQPRSRDIIHDRGTVTRVFNRSEVRLGKTWSLGMNLFVNHGDLEIPYDPHRDHVVQAYDMDEWGSVFELDHIGTRLQVSARLHLFHQAQGLRVAPSPFLSLPDQRVADRRYQSAGLDLSASWSWSPGMILHGGLQVRYLDWHEVLNRGRDPEHDPLQAPEHHIETVPRSTFNDTGALGALFLDQEFRIGSSLIGSVGLRLDHFALIVPETHVSPRINLTYHPGPGPFAVHASYNRLVWAPPVENYLLSSRSPTALPLRATRSDALELGLRWMSQRLRLQVTGFYRFSRFVYHTLRPFDVDWFVFANFDAERIYGLEVQAHYQLVRPDLEFLLNYTLSHHNLYAPLRGGYSAASTPVNTPRGPGFPAPMDQRHTLTGLIAWHPIKTLNLTLSGTWASGLPAHEMHEESDGDHAHREGSRMMTAPVARMPAYLYLNGMLEWKLPFSSPLWLQISGENLLNQRKPLTMESAFTPAQYLPGRKIWLQLRLRW